MRSRTRETICSAVVLIVRFEYKVFYGLKQWAKVNTPLSRWMLDYSAILIDK